MSDVRVLGWLYFVKKLIASSKKSYLAIARVSLTQNPKVLGTTGEVLAPAARNGGRINRSRPLTSAVPPMRGVRLRSRAPRINLRVTERLK